MNQKSATLSKQITKTLILDYLLHVPPVHESGQKLPLMLFLHGSGERGDDLSRVAVHGPPKLVEQGRNFPFILASPQCPADTLWSTHFDALNALLDDIIAAYPVDTSRIYLTGLSMGGSAAWNFAAMYPERFAALVPVCGRGDWYIGDPQQLCGLAQTPIWVFHGALDMVIPLVESAKLVQAITACGGQVRFTVYPEAGHDSWSQAYATEELYTWMLQQSRSS